jgi:uncharacterized protein YecE (DUF72 family)
MPGWWIGCSGFDYKDWKEIFYPAGIPQTKWFEYYCNHFNTIELNTTFYRFPRTDALLKWYDRSPDKFKFSVKAPQLITHYKMFKESERLLGDFYASIYEGLSDKLGCVLFQLPSRAAYNDEMLQRIIEILNPSFDNVVEFRDAGWWNKKVYKQLKKHHISFCGISHPMLPNDAINNTSLLYYRFHGVPVLYKSTYEEEFIQKVAVNIKAAKKIKDVYIYFNNTWGPGGIHNGRQMQQLISV